MFVFHRANNVLSVSASTASLSFMFVGMMTTGAAAQSEIPVTGETIYFPIPHIVTFLFLMLGPTKSLAHS